MKCFVHVGLDPFPKEMEGPSEAVAYAEQYLQGQNDQKFSIYWRRDDLYPKNFVPYSTRELVVELQKTGELTLQLAKVTNDDLPLMGETATIFTAEEEERNAREADQALYFGEHDVEGRLRGFQDSATRKVS